MEITEHNKEDLTIVIVRTWGSKWLVQSGTERKDLEERPAANYVNCSSSVASLGTKGVSYRYSQESLRSKDGQRFITVHKVESTQCKIAKYMISLKRLRRTWEACLC